MSDVKEDEKRKLGQPTKYKKQYCNMLIDHMSKGYSFETFAAVIDVDRDTIFEWRHVHPDFSDAFRRAKDKCQMFWESKGIDHLIDTTESTREGNSSVTTSKKISAAVYALNMANRFGWYSSKKEISGDEKKPLNITMNYERNKKKA